MDNKIRIEWTEHKWKHTTVSSTTKAVRKTRWTNMDTQTNNLVVLSTVGRYCIHIYNIINTHIHTVYVCLCHKMYFCNEDEKLQTRSQRQAISWGQSFIRIHSNHVHTCKSCLKENILGRSNTWLFLKKQKTKTAS